MMHPVPVSDRGVRAATLILRIGVTLGGVLALTGCAEEPPPPPQIHDIGEPWQPMPFAVDNSVLAEVERICRSQKMVPDTVPLSVIDVRGGGVGVMVMADANNEGECLVTRNARGELTMAIGGATSGIGAIQPVGPRAIGQPSVGSATLGPLEGRQLTYVVGQAGSEVGLIEAVLPDGTRIQASNWGRGWFTAWWPGDRQQVRWSLYDLNGVPLAPPN
jgi:hypothetical protein